MTSRIVSKVLIAQEDLALGQGTVSQTRQGVSQNVTKLDLPWVVTSIIEVQRLDTTKYNHCILNANSEIILYAYEGTSAKTVDNYNYIAPNVGSGQWVLKQNLSEVKNYSDLATFIAACPPVTATRLYIESYYSWVVGSGSSKGAQFVYRTGATNSAPSVGSPTTVSSIGTGVQLGYYFDATGAEWKLEHSQDLTAEMFGAVGDGVTDDFTALVNAEAYLGANGGGFCKLDPAKSYALSAGLTIGTTGSEVFFGCGSKNGATFKALSAFTGGIVILEAGGIDGLNFTGFNNAVVGHQAITIGSASVTNPFVKIANVLNNGGFYDFIKTIYEYDRAEFDGITSEVSLGHAAMDLQTGGSYAPAANPIFKRLSLRNPDLSPAVGTPKKYGIILKRSEGTTIKGAISNFDRGLYLNGENRELDISNLLVLDLRSTVSNNLWEDEFPLSTAVNVGDYFKPPSTLVNGHFYQVTSITTGITGGSHPAYPVTHNGTVVSGGVTLTEVGESICVSVGAEQQVKFSTCRFEDGIVALHNVSNANITLDTVRLVGENAALWNESGSNCELVAENILASGDVHLGTFRAKGTNNLIVSDTIGDMPSHEDGEWSNTNRQFKSGNGVDFSATNAAGATSQILDDYAEGAWTPTVTANSNCTVPVIATATYVKIGRKMHCEIEGTVTITATSTDTDFKFTLPFAMSNAATSGVGGALSINWGGIGIASIANWTGANDTEVGFLVPSAFVGATGSQSFSGNFSYIST
jgi:hypothetical protein